MMDDDSVVQRTRMAVMEMALGDVERASAGNAKLGAFILAACTIDYLSCLYAGRDGGGRGYKAFIARFFDDKRYVPTDLWASIRNGLVHNYTVKGGRYAYNDGHPESHFITDKHGHTILNLESFAADVVRAAGKYFDLVETESEEGMRLRSKLVRRVKDVGIMTVFPMEL